MYKITVKWPNGDSFNNSPYSHEQAEAIANFLWASGADDVIIRCICGECETCGDWAAWESM